MPAFMKLDDIKGEATDEDHKGWIIINTFEQGIVRSIVRGAKDQQRTRGGTNLTDAIISRQLDKSSTKLQEACGNGTFFKQVEIHFCTTVKKKQVPYAIFNLENTIVVEYAPILPDSGDPLPSEKVTLCCSSIEWEYRVLDPKTGDQMGVVPAKCNPAECSS